MPLDFPQNHGEKKQFSKKGTYVKGNLSGAWKVQNWQKASPGFGELMLETAPQTKSIVLKVM